MSRHRPHEGPRAGIAMLVAIGLGMAAANSSVSDTYAFIHHYPLRLGIAPLVIEAPLIDWINQGLFVFFFFHISLHIKREMTSGILAAPGRVVVPAIAALGGMIVPGVIYLAFNAGDYEALQGWAIPIATDVVLVLGLMSLLGKAVSPGLLAFVSAVAIFDDMGAILVIALFYGEIQLGWQLGAIAAGLAMLFYFNRRASGIIGIYVFAGGLLWVGLTASGLEGAVAGAIVGLALPLSAFETGSTERMERRIAPLSLFCIVPIFAFFNSGVALHGLTGTWLTDPVANGIIVALVVGKPLGIAIGTYCALRLGVGSLPVGTTFRDIAGGALLAGIGFTMSLFIVAAAFDDPVRADTAKFAVLIGSSLSAIVATAVLITGRRIRSS